MLKFLLFNINMTQLRHCSLLPRNFALCYHVKPLSQLPHELKGQHILATEKNWFVKCCQKLHKEEYMTET